MGLSRHLYFNHSDFPSYNGSFQAPFPQDQPWELVALMEECVGTLLGDLREILILKPDSDCNTNSQIKHNLVNISMYICTYVGYTVTTKS